MIGDGFGTLTHQRGGYAIAGAIARPLGLGLFSSKEVEAYPSAVKGNKI